jgi:3-oxoacyl-[acyl-carrier protein] reductase
LLTGASKGIGAGIARAMAAAGAAVAINYSTDRASAEALLRQIEQNGGKAIAAPGNVASQQDAKGMLERVRDAFGPLDVLVNNAAVYEMLPIEAITESEYRRHFDTNVLGPLTMIREALNYFRPGGGCVINVSSAITLSPAANTALYSGSKGALNMVTDVLARELGPRGIRVNALAPGVTQTEKHRVSEWDAEVVSAIVSRTPLGRIGMPADIAPAAVFLASDAAGWITGASLLVSGGLR